MIRFCGPGGFAYAFIALRSRNLTGTYLPHLTFRPTSFATCRKDPHRIIKATQGDKAEVKRRAPVGIPAFEALSRRGAFDIDEDSDPFPGYPDGVSYASAPRTRYQARAREGIAEDADVELHYTARYSEMVIERVCNVAMKPGADWRSLPRQLHMKKQQGGGATSRDVRFSRINGGGHFRTAMTTVMPHSQGATVIHPSVCPSIRSA